jgi:hypothetical protein
MRSLPLTTLSCRSSEAGFAISLHSLPILSHITDSLSSLFYHTEWIFFVPSKTDRVPKGSIRSHPFVAQVRFKVDLPRIRSHSLQGVLMSPQKESSFLIVISSLTVLTISLVSSVIATLCVPLLRNNVFIIIVFDRGSWSEDPFLTLHLLLYRFMDTMSSLLCNYFALFSNTRESDCMVCLFPANPRFLVNLPQRCFQKNSS